MRSNGGGKTNHTSQGFWCAIGAGMCVIGLATAVLFTLISCGTAKEFLRPSLIEQEADYGNYVLFLKAEKRADCQAPYFILIGKVAKDKPIEMISVKRLTHPLKSPDQDATMNGNEFRLVGPPIQRGQTDQFDLKVTLADTGQQIVIGRVIDSPGDCPAKK